MDVPEYLSAERKCAIVAAETPNQDHLRIHLRYHRLRRSHYCHQYRHHRCLRGNFLARNQNQAFDYVNTYLKAKVKRLIRGISYKEC